MAACVSCKEKKGKRDCPALRGKICPLCCGEKRVVEIDCPKDCPHLKAGEDYQKERRSGRALVSGRDYIQERVKTFKDRDDLNFAAALESAIHVQHRVGGAPTDHAVIQALEQLPLHLGTLEAVISAPDPLARALAEKVKKDRTFETYRTWPRERLTKFLDRLKSLVKVRAGKDGTQTGYLDFIGTYFGTMVSEREILQELRTKETDPPDQGTSPGGILLP
jgi:hypothetical protein